MKPLNRASNGKACAARSGVQKQGPTPIRGDWPLYPNTGYAIEGNVKVKVPAWDGQRVQIKLEQSAAFDGERVIYLAGRQTEWHVVR